MPNYTIFNFLRADTSEYFRGIELPGIEIQDTGGLVGTLPSLPVDQLTNFIYGAQVVTSSGAKQIELERVLTSGNPHYDVKISTYLHPETEQLYTISRNDSITKAYVYVNTNDNGEIIKAAFLSYEPDENRWYLSFNITELVDALEGSRAGHRQGELAVKVKTTDPNKPFYFSYISDATYPGTYWPSAQQYPFPVTGCRDAYDILYTKTNNWHNVMWNDDEENIMATTEEASSIEDFIENFVKPNVEVLGTEIMEYALESMIGVGGVIFTLENGVNFYATPTGRTNYGVAYWNFYLRDSENNIITFKDRNGSTYPASWVNIGIGEATEHPSGEYSQNGFQALYLVKSPKDTQSTEGEIALVGVIKKHTMSQSTPERYFLALVGEPAGSRGNNIRTSIVLGETSTEILDEDTTTIEPTGGEIPEPGGLPGDEDIETEGAGGEANYNESYGNDSIPVPTPDEETSITGTNENDFARLYNPTPFELRKLSSYMTTSNILAEISKFFKDPMDFLVSLHKCPGTVTQGDPTTLKIGNTPLTNLTMHKIADQKKVIDCGSVTIDKRWGSCNDYAPHVAVQIYLPFIGYHTLDPNMIMPEKTQSDTTLSLKYNIDYLTGGVVAVLYKTVKDKQTQTNVNMLVGQWAGNAMYQIPVTSTKNEGIIGAVGSIAIAGATMGISASLSKSATKAAAEAKIAADRAEGGFAAARMAEKGKLAGDPGHLRAMAADQEDLAQSLNKVSANKSATAASVKTYGQIGASQAVGNIGALAKTSGVIGSGIGGAPAFDMCRKPYLIIERCDQIRPRDFVPKHGLPAHMESTVINATNRGEYVQYSSIKVDGCSATREEQAMIEQALLKGVYL